MTHSTLPESVAHEPLEPLLAAVASDPWGEIPPSVYETGRVVALAPWLPRHRERVEYLLETQHGDGAWGGPDAYALVPTLSAVEALLRVADAPAPCDGDTHGRVVRASERGLDAARRLTARRPPDTVAAELIVPALVGAINARAAARLALPPGIDERLLAAVRSASRLPAKLLHSLEALGDAGRGAAGIDPGTALVGASPAATAAWLGRSGDGHGALRCLTELIERTGGPVPVFSPVTVVERAWVLNSLAVAGLAQSVPPALVRSLESALGEHGAHGAPGLPPDADDSAVILTVLMRLGSARRPDCLWAFEDGGRFFTYPNERTPSTSTNAHVLEAFGTHLLRRPDEAPRCPSAMRAIARWLCERQQADGSWSDKWHASPYYATVCCVLALDRFGGPESGPAVRKAIKWVARGQRDNGSWGAWTGTAEETAYAVQTLLATRASDAARAAATRGCAHLRRVAGGREHPPLWHDKDLYTLPAVVRAAELAALELGRRRLGPRAVAGA